MNMIKLTLTFESDWHVGEGAGSSGHIDRIVRRHPEDSLPYVPAKTLTGILRDGCEKIAHGLDGGKDDGAWQQLLGDVFGKQSTGTDNPSTTTHALLSIGAARFDAALRKNLVDSPELRAALVFIKPGIKVDNNGIAEAKMLRFEEVVLANARLTADGELDLPEGEARQAALALLAAGAKAVERLGAKRRRGNGRCVLKMDNTPDKLADILGKAPPIIPGGDKRLLKLESAPTESTETGWHVINLDLKLLSPVVVSADTVGNVIGTRDYVPGSLLLPALDSKLRKLLGAQAPFLTSMLACGHIQIRNAYPCSGGERLLPVPAALMAEKENPGEIINKFCVPTGGDNQPQRKQLRAGYTASDGLPVTNDDKSPSVMVKTAATTHAVVDDEFQRPTKRVGGVYTYEAIRAEQTFRAELWIAKSVLKTPPDPAQLNGEERIGRAKKDDYGRVGITASAAAENKTGAAGKSFTLWLVSPLLVRDNQLRYINDAAAFALWLGTHHKAKLKLDSAFVRSFRDDGWNTAWNEPRPTRFGLAAGSCFQFSSGEEIDGKWLAALEAEGLGERRGEGYGEVRVNALILEQGVPKQVTLANGSKLLHPAYELNPTEFTRQLQLRAWRIGIRRQAVANAESFAECLDWKNKGPPNSQLGALRGLFEGWVTEADRARLGTWLERLRDIPKREEKWPEKTLTGLDSFAASGDAVWSRIEVGKLPLLPCHKLDEMKKAMAAEATRILWLTAIAVEFDRRAMPEKQESPQPESVEN